MSDVRTITVPAAVGGRAGILDQHVPGNYFTTISATGPGRLIFNSDGIFLPFAAGRQTGSIRKPFQRVTFFNDDTTAIAVTFYAGDVPYSADVTPEATVTVIIDPTLNTIVAPSEGLYVIVGAGVEPITADATLFFQSLRLYPASAVAAGILTPNVAADIYLGRSATYLPDKRAITDVDFPVIYDVPVGQRMLLNRIRIKGTAGDGVFFSYV